jgi:outer membrane protein
MTRRAKSSLCRIASLLAIGLVSAAPAFGYDLDQAYRDALSHDAELNSARAALEISRHRVPQARSQLRPAVSASAGINQQYVDTNVAPSRDFTSQNYGISMSYPLLARQEVEAFEQAKLQFSVSEAQFLVAQQDLILRVAEAYFDVLAADNNLFTIEAEKRAISEQLAAAKRNFEVGTATITDQQEAQARFDLTVARELAARNELDIRRAALAQLTGRPVGVLADLREGLTLQPPQPQQEKAWTERARENSLVVQQALLAAEISRREIDRQRYARYPSIDLVGQVGHARNSSASLVGVNSNSASVGIQLGIPLYTGGAIEARVREAQASLEKVTADLEVARRQVEQGARQSYLGLVSGLAQVQALEAAEQSSKLALDSNRLGYQVGVRINIDVLNAQQQLYSTQRDLARARYDVLVNGLRLKSTAGGLAEEDVRRVSSLLTERERVTKPDPQSGQPLQKR